MTSLVDLRDVQFSWDRQIPVIDVPAFQIESGESVFLRGPSGSGKSTLLGLICGVLTPQSGSIEVSATDLTGLSAAKRDQLRADRLGVIFQMFNLLPYLPVIANVTLPCRFSGRRARSVADRGRTPEEEALRLLQRLGLDDPALLRRRVSDLSVGQQQRAAAARALIGEPDLVIADEPTSALDTDARDGFISLLKEEANATDAALLFVSHDQSLAQHFERSVDLTEINQASPHARTAGEVEAAQ